MRQFVIGVALVTLAALPVLAEQTPMPAPLNGAARNLDKSQVAADKDASNQSGVAARESTP